MGYLLAPLSLDRVRPLLRTRVFLLISLTSHRKTVHLQGMAFLHQTQEGRASLSVRHTWLGCCCHCGYYKNALLSWFVIQIHREKSQGSNYILGELILNPYLINTAPPPVWRRVTLKLTVSLLNYIEMFPTRPRTKQLYSILTFL